MRCPECNARTRVVLTRNYERSNMTKRKRVCKKCGRVTYTHEMVVNQTIVEPPGDLRPTTAPEGQ